ncbi:MAG: homocysteine S-methyltransferase family protein [Actinomycetota bacterium]
MATYPQQPRSAHDLLMKRLADGERILIDGGTGTEIEKRGITTVEHAWSSTGALDNPDIVRGVHEDYLRAGAELVISNTFSTSRHALTNAGLGEHFERLNREGVILAREAAAGAGRDVLVAGGITHWHWTMAEPDRDELWTNVADQARIMADAGADLLILEMMADVDRTLAILDAARTSGLPVWVGFSTKVAADGTVWLYDETALLADGVKAMASADVPVLAIMHTEVVDVDPSLDVVDQHWTGPVAVYAHSGLFVEPNWIFDGVISAEDHAAAVGRWIDRGVQVIGGCCGIGPDHIEALRPLVHGDQATSTNDR